MTRKKKEIEATELVFVIEYRVDPGDAGAISEIMKKVRELRDFYSAEILDISVERKEE